jgi:hypothetical protein
LKGFSNDASLLPLEGAVYAPEEGLDWNRGKDAGRALANLSLGRGFCMPPELPAAIGSEVWSARMKIDRSGGTAAATAAARVESILRCETKLG